MFEIFTALIKSMILTGAYQNQVFKDPLSAEKEAYYIDRLKNNDKYAREVLIEHNLRLVAHIVKKYSDNRDEIDDLISIGTIGLIKGVDSFKESNGAKLTTYVARCIENEILMHYRNNKKNSKNISLEESIGYDKEGNEITIADVLKTKEPDFIDEIKTKDDIEKLKKYLSVLSDREKNIIIARYGLYGNNEITQKDIAKKLNISRSYVSRIEKRALTKLLREFLRNSKSN
jgi:RNA polymerase sporulation-specific sigma factor